MNDQPKPEVCPKDCQGHVTDGVAHTCPPSPASTEVKCKNRYCASNTAFSQFGCTCPSPASTEVKCGCPEKNCDNGHYPLGMNEDDTVEWGGCPKCVKDGKHLCDTPASTEDWEKEFDRLWPHLAIFNELGQGDATQKVKDFIRSHNQQLRQRIVEKLGKMKKNTDPDSQYATPDNGYDRAIEEAQDFITNLK